MLPLLTVRRAVRLTRLSTEFYMLPPLLPFLHNYNPRGLPDAPGLFRWGSIPLFLVSHQSLMSDCFGAVTITRVRWSYRYALTI